MITMFAARISILLNMAFHYPKCIVTEEDLNNDGPHKNILSTV